MNNKNQKKYLQVNKKYMRKSIEKLTEPNILLQIFLQKITPKIIAQQTKNWRLPLMVHKNVWPTIQLMKTIQIVDTSVH